jgi:formate hydrogenlyase transcriptional activator
LSDGIKPHPDSNLPPAWAGASLVDQLCQAAPYGIALLDRNLRYISVNRRMAVINGLPVEDHIGRTVFEIIPDLAENIVPYYRRVLTEGASFTGVHWRVDGADVGGRERDCQSCYHPLRDDRGAIIGLIALVQDVSDLKRAERRMIEEKQLSDNVIESLPGFFFMIDRQGRLKRWNKNCETIKGYSPTELADRPAIDLISAEDRPAVLAALDRAMREGFCTHEHRLIMKDGRTIPVLASAAKASIGGDDFIIGLEIDVTERKRVEEALAERYAFESLMAELSAKFVRMLAADVDLAITESLQEIVEMLGVDRGTLMQFSEGQEELRVTHSFAIPGVAEMPSMVMNAQYPYLTEKMRKGEVLRAERLADVPDGAVLEKSYFANLGIESSLAIPVMVGGAACCVLAFISHDKPRPWPEELVQKLRMVGEIFANALTRKLTEESLREAVAEIRSLKEKLEVECIFLREEIKLDQHHGDIIGQSNGLQQVLHKVERVAKTETTVLILGETGTGKELVARAVHDASLRRNRPLVKVSCAALPPDLIESELFGHERGAYTGAHARQIGRFDIAHGATIFLDEIGELSLAAQSKLLRVLQDGEFERLGSSKTNRVDVRVIAATNRNLEAEVRAGRFREDLWYRLNVYPIVVPPLRARRDDIPQLVHYFVGRYGKSLNKTIHTIPQGLMDVLQSYAWPGNVRELENVIERAVICTPDTELRLAEKLKSEQTGPQNGVRTKTLEEMEQEYIRQVLQETHWRIEGKNGAAEALGLRPSTLRGRIRKLGLRRS